MAENKEKIIKAEIKKKEVETEHLKVKGRVEERIIHAYSMLAIRVGAMILAIVAVALYIIKSIGFI